LKTLANREGGEDHLTNEQYGQLYAALAVFAAPQGRQDDPRIVDALLAKATLGTTEDGDLCIWQNHMNSEQETALAMIGEPTGDNGEFTPEDTPFLTDDQRAHINGTIPNATGVIDDKPTIRAALAFALGVDADAAPETPE
ncbi:MAG: hypothetical protein Q8K55_11375, partial [Gemmatimonadaceae bacterium]|nr:hypothetical protein [Gemmatimonadaceae bacterium]